MKKGLTELVFILDRSGSMGGLESDTIGGFNSMMEKQQKEEGDCNITTVLFDNSYELLHDRIDIKAIKPITDREYYVRGTTALVDAIGKTINKLVNVQKQTAEDFRAEKVMFVIITDGYENASREYTADTVKALVESQKEKYGWEFVFLGANIDAVETAGHFGIKANRAVDYLADAQGTALNFNVMTEAMSEYRQCASPSPSIFDGHLNKIKDDVKKRGSGKLRNKKKQ